MLVVGKKDGKYYQLKDVDTLWRWVKLIDTLLRKVATAFIFIYKTLLSPFFGPSCRFHPTCSSYAMEAFNKKPFHKALLLTVKRISKCHPYHEGGYDPVP